MDLDELDIYDDLDTFQEKEEKKSNELLSLEAKYNESLKAYEDLQKENADLKKQIKRIGINFQNLLDTAKAEIKRKDKQIEELRKEKDDICFRRKQPRSEYDTGTSYNIDNWYKKEQTYSAHDLKAEEVGVENAFKSTLHTGHARDPRMRDVFKKFTSENGKFERKPESDMHCEIEAQPHVQKDHFTSRFGTHITESEEYCRGSARNHSRDCRDTERGRKDERDRRAETERRDERGRKQVRSSREERDHRQEHDRKPEQTLRTERSSMSMRNFSSEKEKHTYISKHEGNDRRQYSHDKINERIRHTSKEDKLRSFATNGSRECRNDYKKIHGDTYMQRTNDFDNKSLGKISKIATNIPTKKLDIQQHQDTLAKSSNAVDTKSETVKQVEDGVLLGKDGANDRIAKSSNGSETTNENNSLLCKKVSADMAMLNLNEKSMTENNSLTAGKVLALQEQFNEKNIDPNFNCTFPLGDMTTPKKAALFNSLFGSTPSNAEKVNNTLLNDVMVLLKNNNYSATTSPSNYTDTSGEQLIQSTKMSDIDECFVLNKGSGQKQRASDFPDNISQEELWASEIVEALGNTNKDKNATIILLSDDDEADSDVIAVNGTLCSKQSTQNLTSVERGGGVKKGEIKILENIRLPNIYEIRAQQRRLREEAAKNIESKKSAMVNCDSLSSLTQKPMEMGLNRKTKDEKHETGNFKMAIQDRKGCTGESNANQLELHAVDGSKVSSDIATKIAITTGNCNVIKIAADMSIQKKIDLIEGKYYENVNTLNENMKSVCETKAKNNADENGIETLKPVSNELEKAIEKPMKAKTADTIASEKAESIRECKTSSPSFNKVHSEEHVENQTQNLKVLEYKNSQDSVIDKKIEMEIDLTAGIVVVEIVNEAEFSAPKKSLLSSDYGREDKTLTQNIDRSKTDMCEPKNTTLNECFLVVELSDDEETDTRAHAETDTEMKNIPETLISEDGNTTGSYNNKSLGNVEKHAQPVELTTDKQEEPTEVLDMNKEECTEKERESAMNKDKGGDTYKKGNSKQECQETLKINCNSTEDSIECSNDMKDNTREDLCKLNNTDLSGTKVIKSTTEDVFAFKQSEFVIQTPVEVQQLSGGKNYVGANNESLELENNQDAGHTADKELEDAVAYLVNTMDVDNNLYLDETTKIEHNLKDNKKLCDANAFSKASMNDGSNSDQNSKGKLDLENAKNTNMELSRNAISTLSNNEQRVISQHTELKLLNKTEPETSHYTELKLLPNKATDITKNSNIELRKNSNVKLLNNTELETSPSTEVNLLQNVDSEHKMNASLGLSKIEHSKLLNNAEEHSQITELKVNPERSNNSKSEHSQTANPKTSQSNSLLTSERCVLVDNMKRSEIMWKFKIPKLSAKRRRENSDETTNGNDSALNGELTKDNIKKNTNTNVTNNQDNPLQQQKDGTCQEISLNNKKSKKEEKCFDDKKLYSMQDEIEIVEIHDDIELIETRLLTGQTPEEKRTLSADREKSERIIKEIDNWARRKVGEIPDIIESVLLFETAQADTAKIKKSVEEIPKSNENAENKKAENAKAERKSVNITKCNKSDPKLELKNVENTYAPLLTLKLCEQHEKENERQLANLAAVKNEDFKTGQLEHILSKRAKYENPTDGKRSETQVKHKTDTQKRGTERKIENKSQNITPNNSKGNGASEESQKNHKNGTYDTTNKRDRDETDQSLTQPMKGECLIVSDTKKAMSGNSSSEIKGVQSARKQGQEIVGKTDTDKSNTEAGKTAEKEEGLSGELEDKVKKSRLNEKTSAHTPLEAKNNANVIAKHKEQQEKDREIGPTLKRAGEACKTKLSIDKRDADTQEKRAKLELDAKKGTNSLKTTESSKKFQVPSAQAVAAISTASSNHSTKGTTSIDKSIETKLKIRSHKRQRLDIASDNEDREEVMPKPRKRKRCEMRIEDSDEDEYNQKATITKKCTHISKANTTDNKDILAILQNDSANGNNEYSGVAILPGPQTPTSLPADISQDDQYREIDSRMQLMFASPKISDKTAAKDLSGRAVIRKVEAIKETQPQLIAMAGDSVAEAATSLPIDSSASTPLTEIKVLPVAVTPIDFNVSDTCFSDFNSNSFQVSSRNITIDETQNNEMDISMNYSSLSDSSLSTKHISLGSSDYRFEKVSDNVVNLFITRKRRGKRKHMATAATTTNANTIKTTT